MYCGENSEDNLPGDTMTSGSQVTLPHEPTAEDFRFNPPSFPVQDIADLLLETYGIRGGLTALAGERDQNFRVVADDGRTFVLKISSPEETTEAIDFQIRALEHIRRMNAEIGVPRPVPARNGRLRCCIFDADGISHHVRLLTHVPGVPLDTFKAPTTDSVQAVGALMGRLVCALDGVTPPEKPEFLPWDVMNGLVVMDGFSDRYLPPALRDTCEPFLNRFASDSLPQLHALPAQVIHNDLHPGNVLCEPGNPARLTGCIDFGDMAFRPILMELASSLGEFAGAATDFVACSRAMLSGFRARVRLPDELLPLLYDATLARAILCVQLAMFRLRHANLDPAIETTHLPAAIDAVKAISSIDRREFAAALATTP